MTEQQTDINGNASPAATEPFTEELAAGDPSAGTDARPVRIFCHQCQQKLDVTEFQPFSHITCPVCGAELIIPQWFDSYLLEEPCGIGGMATVYRALDVALDREIAVKILTPGENAASVQIDAFLNEARTAATINHSAVIPIYTCGIHEQQAYIVMQFMAGGSLETKLRLANGTPLPAETVLQWLRDAAEGLEYAARHGIVHHDVKPGNIMLDADGNAKIGDFGIARDLHAAAGRRELWGSPLYISPEKISTGTEDSSGDIYSLGASFYHLLTGVPPFQSENQEELLWERVRRDPVPPLQLRGDLPPTASTLLMQMMHRQPEMRPTYDEIIRILDSVMNCTATTPLALLRNYPLPKSSAGAAGPSSAVFRVKSPSTVLKRQHSRIPQQPAVPPGALHSKPVPRKTPENEKSQTTGLNRKNRRLLVLMLILSVCALLFLAYSVLELLTAYGVFEKTPQAAGIVFSAQ